MRSGLLFSFVATLLLLSSCSMNEFETDISDVSFSDVKFKRLDVDLFETDTSNLKYHTQEMLKKYGSFYPKFCISVLGNGPGKDSSFAYQLKSFICDKDMRMIYDKTKNTFTNDAIKDLEIELTNSFKRAKKLFPDTSLPKQFVLFHSGLNYRNINVDSTTAVGLEFYLGSETPIYNQIPQPIPAYRKRQMDRQYVLRDVVLSWVLFKFDQNEPENNLLQSMIESGKYYYCTKRLLPDIEDSVLFGYTSKQMKYCDEFEKDLWKFFSEKNRLYLNDMKEILSFNTEGPFTAAISKDCPPAIARYMGYRIVCAYMRRNSNVSLPGLMTSNDAQKVLIKAKYKP
ncbi:MAG: hypothetical protein ACK5D5_12255 [Bacteroidota bacterium]|jgi:hypothetical protein